MGIFVPNHVRFLSPDQHRQFVRWCFDRDEIEFRIVRSVNPNGGRIDRSFLKALDSVPQSSRDNAEKEFVAFALQKDGSIARHGSRWNVAPSDFLPGLNDSIASRIYRFSPERFCAGTSAYGDSPVLKTDASNLPEVLNLLQPNPIRFQEYNRLVSQVLPQVKWVDIHSRGESNEISIWNYDRELGRDDLAIPLADCGTGVGHVLAILYVVFTSRTSRTILIDEPQSFLHPGAARRLMEILSGFPRHQLIIATHSPTIISAGAVSQVLSMKVDQDAKIETISWDDADHRATLLNELGARLADVYGADNILWVEGPTEEECFPKILRSLTPGLLTGTAILAVRKTGDLEGRDAERAFEIYRSLSTSGSLLPPTLAFLFDRECWSEARQKELLTKSNGLLRTTDRRAYENYILHAGALADLINRLDVDRESPVSGEEIELAIEKLYKDAAYACKGTHPKGNAAFFLNAPKILEKLFNQMTETRVSFNKTTHSVALTEWILKNDPKFLGPRS